MTKVDSHRLGTTAVTIAAATVMAIMQTAHAATTYYAKPLGKLNDSTRMGNLTNIVQWCTDQALTTLADPQPVITANDGNSYVFVANSLNSNVKITQPTTFPEGVNVCFGTDGEEVGTSASMFNARCTSENLDIPSCTIYGFRWCPDYRNNGVLSGNYRLVKTANKILFGGSNLKDGVTYGTSLGGKFTGDSDVMITVLANSLSTPQVLGNCIVQVNFQGDFSEYKGKFETAALTNEVIQTGFVYVRFKSATSMGDPTAKCDDAVTLRHRGYIRIDEAVTQSAARGITLDLKDDQFASLHAATDVKWTLRTPVHGSTGTLKKTGVGVVTIASALEPTNIVVEAGTLVISNGVSFAEGTTLTVASGATCTNLVQGTPNLTVVAEEGGTYVCPLDAVSYDGTAVATPLDCTSFTAADRAALAKPIPIALSQAIPIPFIATNRIAVATFSAAAGFTGDDFIDVSPKQYRYLPVTWFETVTEGDVTTLYLVARPAIYGYGNKNLNTATNYTDRLSPHRGADYYCRMAAGSMRTGGGTETSSFNFYCDTFTYDTEIRVYAGNFYASELRLYGNTGLYTIHQSNVTPLRRLLRGTYNVTENATLSNPAYISLASTTPYTDLNVKLIGSGTLKIHTRGTALHTFIFSNNGSEFAGRLYLTTDATNHNLDMYATNGLAFGGPIDTYTADAVRIAPVTSGTSSAIASLTASADMTVNAANRGWYITSAALGASNDVTFTFSPPTLTLTEKLRKTGGGTLAMGCATIGAGTVFNVEEGFVKPLSATCCTNLDLTVASGAGLKVDAAPADEEVAAKGLIAKSIQPAEAGGEIAVVIDMPSEIRGTDEIAVPICTVPADVPDLTGAMKVKAPVGYSCTLVADGETYADDGLVTYKARLIRVGFRLIVR